MWVLRKKEKHTFSGPCVGPLSQVADGGFLAVAQSLDDSAHLVLHLVSSVETMTDRHIPSDQLFPPWAPVDHSPCAYSAGSF